MIDLDPSVVTLNRQGESSTSASTQTDASELSLSASDASNEQKFTNSSTYLKFIAFMQIQRAGRENTTETRNICSGGNKLKVICSLDLLLQLFAQKLLVSQGVSCQPQLVILLVVPVLASSGSVQWVIKSNFGVHTK